MKQLKDGDNLEQPYVIDFYADWCGPCKTLSPAFEALSSEKPEINFYKCNIDDAPNLVSFYNIRNIPFVVAVNNNHSESGIAKSKQDILAKMATVGL